MKDKLQEWLENEDFLATRGEAYVDEDMRDYLRSLIDPRQDFAISFEGEAWEVFQTFISRIPGYGVTVTTQDGEVIPARLIGGRGESEWGDAITIQPVDEKYDDIGPERTVRVGRVEVH